MIDWHTRFLEDLLSIEGLEALFESFVIIEANMRELEESLRRAVETGRQEPEVITLGICLQTRHVRHVGKVLVQHVGCKI